MSKLSDICETMRRSDPVFIVGCARSGTSMLYRALLKHSAFVSPQLRAADQFHRLAETHIFEDANKGHLLHLRKPPFCLDYMLHNKRCYELFMDATRHIRFLHRLTPRVVIPHMARHSLTVWKMGGNAALVQAFFHYAHEARGGRRVIEKTPGHYAHLDKMGWAFPRCKLLIMFRHPVDTFTSYRKRIQRQPNAQWAGIGADAFCRRYEAAYHAVERYRERGGRALLAIRYEDFTQKPVPEMHRILEFIEEPFESQTVQEKDPPDAFWKVDPYAFGPIVEKTKSWGEFMTEEEAGTLETRLTPTMKKLGYTPYVTPSAC